MTAAAASGVSMTGFGRGVASVGPLRVTVELRAVNHRFLEVKVRGATAPAIEDQIATAIRERIGRGAVTAAITVERGGQRGAPRVDHALARALHGELATLAHGLAMPPPTLADVLALPGVIATESVDGDELRPVLATALTAALGALVEHRTTEGAALIADLRQRVVTLRELHTAIAAAAVEAGPIIAQRLRERIDRALAPGAIAPERLAQEVALLVERADVTEELVRAATHLDAVGATLAQAGAVGRRLDFLLQELGREINTTGAKSPTAAISGLVVQAKAELEKMREQVQNLE